MQKGSLLNNFRIWRFLSTIWRAFRQFRLQILSITILSFFNGIFEGVGIVAIIPLLSFVDGSGGAGQDVVSKTIGSFFTFTGLSFSLKNLLIMLTLLFVVKAVLMYWNMALGTRIGYKYDTTTRERLFRQTLMARWPFLSNQKIGYLDQILLTDVNYASTILSSLSASMIICVNLLIYSLIVVNLSISVAFFTVIFGIGLFLLIKPILYRNKSISGEIAKMFKRLAHTINETVVGMKVIRSLAVERPLSANLNTDFRKIGVLKVKNLVFRNTSNIILPPLGFVFVLLMFAYMYKTGQFTIPTFAVLVYAINKVFSNIQLFQSQLHAMTSMLPHLSSVLEYERELNRNIEDVTGSKDFVFNDKILFKDVNFEYPGRSQLLRELSFEIKKGSIVGVAGPSGSGKTTMVDLLLRLLTQTSGEILVDQTAINEISLTAWRKEIGYVSQDPFLLNASVTENIRFFDTTLSDAEVRKFAIEAGISEFVESLPSGYDTMVGERGVLLSGGQRQRIALARVLSRRPKVLILDEATSALDAESEALIQATLGKLKGSITIVIIAHRPGTLLLADKILILDSGSIVEEGSPSTLLLDASSYYFRIVNIANKN
ncbi:MAG TPA: ABC transporter ATP-binding protein [Candidatus Paceibacterota bacterium]